MHPAKRQAWLITNHAPGELLSGYQRIRGDIIAVDAGLMTVWDKKLTPRVIIGDFDSLNPAVLDQYPHIPIIRHHAHKNETDTELALNWCVQEGNYDEIVICNDMQARVDHSLAIIQNLLALFRQGFSARIETESQCLFFISGKTELAGKPGDLISLISYSRHALFKASAGLEYPLHGLLIHQHQSRGISNVFNSGNVTIDLAEGEVLAIYSPAKAQHTGVNPSP